MSDAERDDAQWLADDSAGWMHGLEVDAEACTDTIPHVQDSVRTEAPSETYEAATKRFDVRLAPSQLARWRVIAAEQRCNVAELVRVAVDFAAANMPPGHVADTLQREGAERLQRAFAAAMPGRSQPSSEPRKDPT